MATSRSFGELAKRLTLQARGLGDNAEMLIRRGAIAADTAAVTTTPVKTGRAKGNWRVSIGAPLKEALDVEGEDAATKAMEDGKKVIEGWRLGMGAIFLANNVPYAIPLDHGHSSQAPRGMSRFAIAAARRQLGRSQLLKKGGRVNEY